MFKAWVDSSTKLGQTPAQSLGTFQHKARADSSTKPGQTPAQSLGRLQHIAWADSSIVCSCPPLSPPAIYKVPELSDLGGLLAAEGFLGLSPGTGFEGTSLNGPSTCPLLPCHVPPAASGCAPLDKTKAGALMHTPYHLHL